MLSAVTYSAIHLTANPAYVLIEMWMYTEENSNIRLAYALVCAAYALYRATYKHTDLPPPAQSKRDIV